MTDMNSLTGNCNTGNCNKKQETEQINIDFLLHDVMIIKAESLKDKRIFNYAYYLEKQLLKIKNREAKLELGAQLK